MKDQAKASSAPAETWLARSEAWFINACAVLLILTGITKLVSLAHPDACLNADPVFSFISVCGFLLLGGSLEILSASYLWRGRNAPLKLMLILVLGGNFSLYRIMLWWKSPESACSCLGAAVADIPHASFFLKTMIFCFLAGGLFFVIWPTVIVFFQLLRGRYRRLVLGLGSVLALLILIPPLQVAYLIFFNPTRTLPLLIEDWRGAVVHPVVWRDLDDISPEFVRSVIIAEDQRFFEHGGFDWVRTREAIRDWISKGRAARGVSTITQQCARSIFLWHGRSWAKKLYEAYYAFWMEAALSKRRILELYVNVIELGPGIYGVESAARNHFQRQANTLSPSQATLLVTIMPSPKRWNLAEAEPRLRKRQELLLRRVELVRLPWEYQSQNRPPSEGNE